MKALFMTRYAAIVAAYILLAALWILVSNLAISTLSPDLAVRIQWHVYRDLLLVLVTAVLLYLLLRRDERRRHRAETARQRQEAAFKALVEHAPDLISRFDREYRHLYVNPMVRQITGLSPGDLIGKTNRELAMPEALVVEWEEVIEAAFRTGQQQITEFEFPSPGGDRFLQARLMPELADDGSVVSVLSVVRDLTPFKQANDVLHQWAQIFEHARWGVALEDARDNTIVLYNPAFARMHGYEQDELIDRSVFTLYPPEAHEQLPGYFERTHRLGHFGFESPHLRRDGSTFPAFIDKSTITSSDGRVLYRIVNVQDITDRKQAENALRESEERFRLLADVAPVLIWMSDPSKQCTYVNQRWLDLTGRNLEQEIDQGWLENIHPDDKGERWQVYSNAFDARQPFSMEYRLRRYDGEYRWLTDDGGPRFTSSGDFLGYVGSCSDVTERKRTEEASRRLNELLEQRVATRTGQLEEANQKLEKKVTELQALEAELTRRNTELEATTQELESFAYSVSHDLRAPLRAIDGFSMALIEDNYAEISDDGRRYLQRIRAASQRMALLIDDLLKLSRVSRTHLDVQPVNLSHLADTILSELQERAPQRQVELIVQEGLNVAGDTRLLRILMENLLENAWKFSRDRAVTCIKVGALQEDSAEEVYYVRDNGVGFDMAYADKLFGAFQRLHSEREFSGTGIGLATVQRIVHRHGGRLWAEAVKNEGASFYFTLKKGEERE